jgi:hypothetical protein
VVVRKFLNHRKHPFYRHGEATQVAFQSGDAVEDDDDINRLIERVGAEHHKTYRVC